MKMRTSACGSLSSSSYFSHAFLVCSPVHRPARARRVVESSESEGAEAEHVERAKTSAQILQPLPNVTNRPAATTADAVIDLTVSSDEDGSVDAMPTNVRRVSAKPAHGLAARATTSRSSPNDENKHTIPLFVDEDDDDDDPMNRHDGSILVLCVASVLVEYRRCR